MVLDRLSLVLGGAASGKSAFAERLVREAGGAPVYLVTAEARDGEMAAKIAAHRAARGPGWRLVEAPLEPGVALAAAGAREAVLMDCATLWLSNHLLADGDLAAAEARLMAGLDACPAPVVIVSNEVGGGLVPETALGRRFRAAQGGLNQRLAARAGLVVMVIAGLPLVLKGTLPEAGA
jgi:adenosylcobinamide kinase/adenosylcobinamide-phosphate guanylyltransferase